MGCKIIFAPQAVADLEAAVRFIAEENPDAAVRFGNALIDRVAILENFPLLGPPYSKRAGVRKLVARPTLFSTASENRKISWTSCVTGTARKANQIWLRWFESIEERLAFDNRRPRRRTGTENGRFNSSFRFVICGNFFRDGVHGIGFH
jgi:plasmid stabilization system protein ParE